MILDIQKRNWYFTATGEPTTELRPSASASMIMMWSSHIQKPILLQTMLSQKLSSKAWNRRNCTEECIVLRENSKSLLMITWDSITRKDRTRLCTIRLQLSSRQSNTMEVCHHSLSPKVQGSNRNFSTVLNNNLFKFRSVSKNKKPQTRCKH